MKKKEKKKKEEREILELEPKTEEPGIESEKSSQKTIELEVEGKSELSRERKNPPPVSVKASEHIEESMAQMRKVINEPTLAITRHLAETAHQRREMIASVNSDMRFNQILRAVESMKVINEPTLAITRHLAETARQQREMITSLNNDRVFSQVSRAVESMRFTETKSLKQVMDVSRDLAETLRAIQPDWKPILSAIQQGMTAMRDSQIEEYETNAYFQENLKTLSTELITLPYAPSSQVLELLSLEDFELNQLKEMLGVFDVEVLREEVSALEHEHFKFNKYIEEVLENYKEEPERYRLLIPPLLLMIEGTLSETFKISERGTAREIKQKMNLFWDLFQASYVQRSFDKSGAFYNQVLLSNIKTVFEELTSSSNHREGVKINRNLILHGRSNPDEWLEEDFLTLTQLLNTALYIKRSLNIMLDEFMELTSGSDSSVVFIEYTSNLMNVIASIKKQEKAQLTLTSTEVKLTRVLRTDLKDVFENMETVIEGIIRKCNVDEVAAEAFRQFYIEKPPRKLKKK